VVDALLALRDGEARHAAGELEAICGDTRDAGLALEVIWTQLDLGRALVVVERSRAADTFRAAAAGADELGAGTLVELAEHELRSLGVHTWRRSEPATRDELIDRLTKRERDVAILAAGGASNPEIARRLFVSRKTVERHISNALAKVGARNRTELAARLARQA